MENSQYSCSKCKKPVVVLPEQKPIKACKCEKATIIANMEATVIRSGGGLKA